MLHVVNKQFAIVEKALLTILTIKKMCYLPELVRHFWSCINNITHLLCWPVRLAKVFETAGNKFFAKRNITNFFFK